MLTDLTDDRKKGSAWCRKVVDQICKSAISTSSSREMMIKCYDIYYGRQRASDFNYLTGDDNYKLPSKVRSIPIIRSFFDLLQSTFESQPIEPLVYVVDNDGIRDKYDERAKTIMDGFVRGLRERQLRIYGAMQQIKQAQAAQQGSGQTQPDPGLVLAQRKIEMMSAELEDSDDILQEQIESLQRSGSAGFATEAEMSISDGMEYLINTQKLPRLFAHGFKDLYVVDNAIFRLEDVYQGLDPSVRRVSPLDIYYSASSNVTSLTHANWIMERRMLTADDVITQYGHKLSKEDIQTIREIKIPYGPTTMSLYEGMHGSETELTSDIMAGCEPDSLYSGSVPNAQLIEVCECSWLSPRKIDFALYPNKHDSSLPIIKLVSDEERVRPSARIESRYIMDRYEGVRINGSIYVSCGLAPMQLREHPTYGNATQPYAGFCYNNVDFRPYSRVQAVADVDTLYKLVYFQIETLMVLSGVRGFVLDIAQLPKDWTLEKFLYYARQGIAPIDSTMPNIKNARNTGFNQFTQFDQTFGTSIQQLQALLTQFEHLAGRLIGIPPQRLGEIMPHDQVGTHRQAIAQSNMTTQVLFNKMDTVVMDTLNLLLRAMPHCWAEGKRGQFVLGNKGQKMVNIAKGAFEDRAFECYMQTPTRDQEVMDKAITLITQNFQGTGMPLSQLVTMFGANSLREVKHLLAEYEKLAMKKAQEGAKFQAEHEKEIADLEARAAMAVKEVSSKAEMAGVQVQALAQQVEERNAQLDASTKLQIAGMKNETDRYKADQETAVEAAVLQEQRRSADMDAQLEMIKIMTDKKQGAKPDSPVSSPRSKENPK